MEKMRFSDLLSNKFNLLLEYKDGESIPSYDRNSIIIKNIIFFLDNIVIKTHKKIEDQKDPSQEDYTIFEESYTPQVSIHLYINRLIYFLKLSEENIIAIILLLIKYVETTNTHINCLNCHRLLITSALICEKMYNDNSGDYKIENFIAKVGGV